VASVRAGSAQDAAVLAARVREAEPVIAEFLAREHVPGAAVAWVRGEAVRIQGFGHARPDGAAPDADTEFEIGSCTKVFTALLLADAALRGEVTLDEPVQALLPPGMHVPVFGAQAITLEHLATHTSALPRLPTVWAPAREADPYGDFDAAHLTAALAATTLARAPGAAYEYSNFGAGLLGFALANHQGRTLEAALRRRVLDPLEMLDTGIELSAAQRARLAQGHDDQARPVPGWTFDALAGAGALHSTARDMVRFVRTNLHPAPPLADALLLAQIPRAPAPAVRGAVGLGWHVLEAGRTLFHNGGTAGFHAFVALDRGADVGVVILANGDNERADELGMDLLHRLRGEAPAPPRAPDVTLSPAQIDALVGVYALSPAFQITVRRPPVGIEIQATNQPAISLEASSPTEFRVRGVDARISFELGADGRAARLVLHQNGRDAPGERVP
jgi:CubicO group peptidase (beta-lactamase class C family)